MSLAEQLVSDLRDAMKSGDTQRREVIRFLRASIKNAEIDKHAELTDEEIEAVIRGQIKQRRDSIDMFRKGGRDDLADAEAAQVAVLQTYLPAQISDDEAEELVRRVVEESGATSPKEMGKLMPALMQAAAGRVEGRTLSALARAELERRSTTA
ncbi:MAG: GatB/YqeY domain-containing protein [Thermomicrobiales bacterium]|nr:GatB/YqeY domain-containing protein [Thermomicrobiales bacterium]